MNWRKRRCARRGHKWRQKVAYMLGDRVCHRCGLVEVDPAALPPEGWLP
jgi:hypothetical protein